MDLQTRSLSRVSIRVNDKMKKNNLPLYSRISIYSNFMSTESVNYDESLLGILQTAGIQESQTSQFSCALKSLKKAVSYGKTQSTSSFYIDINYLLQIITQQTTDQLAIIVGKSSPHKTKLYKYETPDERFNKKPEYKLEQDIPTKTFEQKMLKIQQIIKGKIDEMILFLHNILRDTSEELRYDQTYDTLAKALQNAYAKKSDDFAVLNMNAEELCTQLFRDIKRIDRDCDRMQERNRAVAYGFLGSKDRVLFLNLKQLDYIEKYEASRMALNKYIADKQCDDIAKYIRSFEDKILKDKEVTQHISNFLNSDIEELERKRDEYPDKLDNECDLRRRVITQFKDELEEMQIHRKELAAEIKLRTQKMNDWIIYRDKKAIEDAELERIAAEEELARQEEEERILAEILAEEEFLATLTPREKDQYFKNKKKEERKAAKAAKKAARLAKKKERRKA